MLWLCQWSINRETLLQWSCRPDCSLRWWAVPPAAPSGPTPSDNQHSPLHCQLYRPLYQPRLLNYLSFCHHNKYSDLDWGLLLMEQIPLMFSPAANKADFSPNNLIYSFLVQIFVVVVVDKSGLHAAKWHCEGHCDMHNQSTENFANKSKCMNCSVCFFHLMLHLSFEHFLYFTLAYDITLINDH